MNGEAFLMAALAIASVGLWTLRVAIAARGMKLAGSLVAAMEAVVFEEFFETTFADLPEGANTLDEAQFVAEAWDVLFDDVVTPRLDEQMAELRALGAPEGDADLLAVLYDDVDRALVARSSTTLSQAI